MTTTVPAQPADASASPVSILADLNLPAAIYRLFDTDDVLLYVGVTGNLRERLGNHSRTQRWWPEVARKAVEWYPTRTEAEDAEKRAIREERPLYNRAGADRSQRIKQPNPAAEISAWEASDAASIVQQVGRLLARSDLSHAHARLRALNLVLTGQDELPGGAALTALADQCGASHREAYRLLRTEREAS